MITPLRHRLWTAAATVAALALGGATLWPAPSPASGAQTPSQNAAAQPAGGKGSAELAAGTELFEKKELAMAIRKFEEAKRKQRDDADILAMLGRCQKELGRTDEARESLAAALKLRPRWPLVRAVLGECYLLLAKEQMVAVRASGADAAEVEKSFHTAWETITREAVGGK